MNTQRFSIKLFLQQDTHIAPDALVGVFHEWIRTAKLPELMIDVAEYGHTHHGPHVYFCGHESDYIYDLAEGRPGLVYVRKRSPADTFESALVDALRRVLQFASWLEQTPGLTPLNFGTTEVIIRILDRLNAPNSTATFDAFQGVAAPVMSRVFGDAYGIIFDSPDPRETFAVRVVSQQALPLQALLQRLP